MALKSKSNFLVYISWSVYIIYTKESGDKSVPQSSDYKSSLSWSLLYVFIQSLWICSSLWWKYCMQGLDVLTPIRMHTPSLILRLNSKPINLILMIESSPSGVLFVCVSAWPLESSSHRQIKHHCFLFCSQPSRRACKSRAGGKCGGDVVLRLIIHSHASPAPLTKWEWSHRYHILQVVDELLFLNALHLEWNTVKNSLFQHEGINGFVNQLVNSFRNVLRKTLVGSQIRTTQEGSDP